MARLFGNDLGLFLLWLQVPKDPTVPAFSASQSWKISLDHRIHPSASSHILVLIFFCSLLCWSQLSEENKQTVRWHCLLWSTLFYYLFKFYVLFFVALGLLLSEHFSSRGLWGWLSSWGAWASHCYALSCRRAWAPESISFSSFSSQFNSVQFSCSDFLWPHGLQHARLPCPSSTPTACSNSCPLSWWCHPAILSSVVPGFRAKPQ